jgi:hypothetical protein
MTWRFDAQGVSTQSYNTRTEWSRHFQTALRHVTKPATNACLFRSLQVFCAFSEYIDSMTMEKSRSPNQFDGRPDLSYDNARRPEGVSQLIELHDSDLQ